MIDNVTGKATRVRLWPTRLDMVLFGRDRKLVSGWLLAQIAEAAERLHPGFLPVPVEEVRPPFVATWRRRLMEDDDDGGI